MTQFFISYTRADRQWAAWIASQLEAAGHSTVLQAWDFRPGSNFVEEMDRATTNADRTVVVLSPDSLASDFARSEWQAAFRRDPVGTARRLVPVQVRRIDRQGLGLLGPVVAIDLVGLNEPAARTALLEGIDPARSIPATEIEFPGATEAGARAGDDPRGNRPILLDEAHGQRRWRVPPTADQGYRRLTEVAIACDLLIRTWNSTPLPSAFNLMPYAVVVLATAPQGRFQLTRDEIDAMTQYVNGGGGLLALSAYTGDWHHEANLNQLLANFGLELNRDLVMPSTAVAHAGRDDGRGQVYEFQPDSPFVVGATPVDAPAGHHAASAMTAGVRSVLALSSCSVTARGDAEVVLRSAADSKTFEPEPSGVGVAIHHWEERRTGPADVVAVAQPGAGRVVASGSWKMFLDRFLDAPGSDNTRFLENLLLWLAGDA